MLLEAGEQTSASVTVQVLAEAGVQVLLPFCQQLSDCEPEQTFVAGLLQVSEEPLPLHLLDFKPEQVFSPVHLFVAPPVHWFALVPLHSLTLQLFSTPEPEQLSPFKPLHVVLNTARAERCDKNKNETVDNADKYAVRNACRRVREGPSSLFPEVKWTRPARRCCSRSCVMSDSVSLTCPSNRIPRL